MRISRLGPIGLFALFVLGGTLVACGSIPVPPTIREYYVATTGSDTNSGTIAAPWKTISKATAAVVAGDTVYIRGGQYADIFGGFSFRNSGTAGQPITLSNYPGEQVVISILGTDANSRGFGCWSTTTDPASWQTPKADYIHIIGSDVAPQTLSNGVQSRKGIVIQGPNGVYSQAAAIDSAGCDSWEVAGVDFIDMGFGIFTKNRDYQSGNPNSADYWNVHDNRVYRYYRESGLQFDGAYNTVSNNEIYKVSDVLASPYGCQLLNINGHHNTVKRNTLSRLGSAANCGGILLEWDLADYNTIERNHIYDVPWGLEVGGGDNNIIRNNVIYSTAAVDTDQAGIEINSYDNRTDWPCNETTGGLSNVPANSPTDPNYPYYYNPRNCHSYGNQIYNNTIYGYQEGIDLSPLAPESTIIRNNAIAGWNRGSVCWYNGPTDGCNALPSGVVVDHNLDQGNFGFKNLANHDFRLVVGSALIDTGYNLGSLVPDDFAGTARPQGAAYDIGAYEIMY